jgi:hypothetical protein
MLVSVFVFVAHLKGHTPIKGKVSYRPHAFGLGVLGVLGASLLPGPKWVRAKGAKLAKGCTDKGTPIKGQVSYPKEGKRR